MIEDAIEILTKMYIKEYEKTEKEIIHIKKEDLYRICIKLLKILKQ